MRIKGTKIVIWLAVLFFQLQYLAAQAPTHLPGTEPEPVPITFVNVLIFVVIPMGLLVFYIWWLRQNRKKFAEEKEKEKEKATENENENEREKKKATEN
jgi:hypothetical protein